MSKGARLKSRRESEARRKERDELKRLVVHAPRKAWTNRSKYRADGQRQA